MAISGNVNIKWNKKSDTIIVSDASPPPIHGERKTMTFNAHDFFMATRMEMEKYKKAQTEEWKQRELGLIE